MTARALAQLFRDTYDKWSRDKAPRLGAALSYYTVFSLAPLLIIVIAVAGLLFGEKAAQDQIAWQIQDLMGPDGAKTIQTMLEHARKPSSGILATLIGLVTLLLGSTGVFVELQDALNTIWGVTEQPGGWKGLFRTRLTSFAMILGIGFLLLVSLVASAVLAAAGKFMGNFLPMFLLHTANLVVSLAGITLLFAVVYKVLPDVEIAWSDVWIGAGVTSLLFTIGKFLIGLYLGRSSIGSTYGAAGSLAIIFVWVYYSAQVFFFGAEFTYVYANRYGTHFVVRRFGRQPAVGSG